MQTPIGSRMNLLPIAAMVVIVSIIIPNVIQARPSGLIGSRHKRVSDQRVAELETLMALARLRGKLVTVPVGFGRVDPARIGRRRRSSAEYGLDKLQRFLQAAARDSVITDDSDGAFPTCWNDVEDRRAIEHTDQSI